MVNLWLVSMVNIWLVYGSYMISIWLIYDLIYDGESMENLWRIYGYGYTGIWLRDLELNQWKQKNFQ